MECSLAEILRWSVALPGTKIGEKEISMCFHTWIETFSRVSVRRGKHYESRKWVMSNKTCYYFLPSPLEEDLKMRKVAFFSKYVPLYDIWNISYSFHTCFSCLVLVHTLYRICNVCIINFLLLTTLHKSHESSEKMNKAYTACPYPIKKVAWNSVLNKAEHS